MDVPSGYLADCSSFQQKLESTSTIELNCKGMLLTNKSQKLYWKYPDLIDKNSDEICVRPVGILHDCIPFLPMDEWIP